MATTTRHDGVLRIEVNTGPELAAVTLPAPKACIVWRSSRPSTRMHPQSESGDRSSCKRYWMRCPTSPT